MSKDLSFKSEPITRQKLSDQVLRRLKDMILSGKLAPGDAMPSERELMARFAVGRPAVREALQTLANKGLITIAHGERSRVNTLSASLAINQLDDLAKVLLSTDPENLKHLKQLRCIIEVGTIRLAAQNADINDIKELRLLVTQQGKQLDNISAFIQTDMAFHMRIACITGNPLLPAVTQAMLSWLYEYYRPLLHWSGREKTTLQEHLCLVDCLEKKEAERAARLMTDHLNRSDLFDGVNGHFPE